MIDLPLTILVVDDDEFTAELTGMILEMAGFEVLLATGGGDALAKMAEYPAIRGVVSDMNMPMMDGVQLFTALRQQGFTRPFLLLTGEDAAPLRLSYPEIDAIISKDEELQSTLPERMNLLLAQSGKENHR